jgi:acetyl esterase/lipase
MSRRLLPFLLFLLSISVAQSQVRPPLYEPGVPSGYSRVYMLWPEGAPLAKGNRPIDIPKLYYYPAVAPAAGTAVIVMPGGGYNRLMMEKEGSSEAKWLAAHGVAAFVLQYRLAPTYRYPVPMLDGARAVRLVRSRAGEFGVDPRRIGVWGFSAGGHLAGFLASEPEQRNKTATDAIERVSAHPDFAILSYARLSMEPTVPRKGNLESLLGPNPTPQMIDQISIVRHVTKQTAPSFIFSTTADASVNSLNATAYYDALKRLDVPVELHIFELGPHGAGMGQNLKGQEELEIWPTLLENWMELHGWLSPPPKAVRERDRERP